MRLASGVFVRELGDGLGVLLSSVSPASRGGLARLLVKVDLWQFGFASRWHLTDAGRPSGGPGSEIPGSANCWRVPFGVRVSSGMKV